MPLHILNTTGTTNTATSASFTVTITSGVLNETDQAKVDNLPTNTTTELASKVDKVSGKGLSTNDYDATDKAKVDNVPSNTNTSLSGKVDKVVGKGLSTNDFDNTYKGQLDNAPSNINTSLNAKADLVGGKVPTDQLPASIAGGIAYQSSWNANTNTPTLSDATGTSGYQYKVDVAGTQDLGSGSIDYDIGDILIHNGAIWEKFDQTETITSVNGQTGAVVLTIPDELSDLSEDATHRVVTDAEKATWNSKADTGDIPTTLAELSQDTTHRVVTDTEKGTWNGKAETSAIPTLLSDLTADSTHRTVTDTEKSTWNGKADTGDFADAISITGTHTETTTAINFSSVQGWKITLTENRTFTVSTGLSSSNPVGKLQVVHASNTPTFSDVDTIIESPVNKSGVYYLVFEYQPDGTITQRNSSGGGVSTLEELSGITTNTTYVNLTADLFQGKPLALNPTINTTTTIGETLTGTDNYWDPLGNAQSGSTYAWYRCDDLLGTNDVLIAGETSKDYTLLVADAQKYIKRIYTPANASATGSAYTSYSGQIGYEVIFDDNFTNWSVSTTPDNWTVQGSDGTNYVEENANGIRFVGDGANFRIIRTSLTIGETYRVTTVIYSITSGSTYLLNNSINRETYSVETTYQTDFTAGAETIAINRFATPLDMVIRSMKVEKIS